MVAAPPDASSLHGRIEALSRASACVAVSLFLAMLGGIAAGWVFAYGLLETAPPLADPGLYKVELLAQLPFALKGPAALFVGVLLGFWVGLLLGVGLLLSERVGPNLQDAGVLAAAGAAIFGVSTWCWDAPGWSALSVLSLALFGCAGFALPWWLRGERAFQGDERRAATDRAALGVVLGWLFVALAAAPALAGVWKLEAPATAAGGDAGAGAGADGDSRRVEGHAEAQAEQRAAARFRDRWLLGGGPGQVVSDFYYRYSPYAAHSIDRQGAGGTRPAVLCGLVLVKGVFWSWGRLGLGWIAFVLFVAYGPAVRLCGGSHRAVLYTAMTLLVAGVAVSSWRRWNPDAVRLAGALAEVESATRYEAGEARHARLRSFLSHAEPDVRYEACYALAEGPAPEDREPLRARLADADARVRLWSARALGALRDADAADALARLLTDPSLNVRCHAAWALGEIGGRTGADALQALRTGDDLLYVRMAAAEALEKLEKRGQAQEK